MRAAKPVKWPGERSAATQSTLLRDYARQRRRLAASRTDLRETSQRQSPARGRDGRVATGGPTRERALFSAEVRPDGKIGRQSNVLLNGEARAQCLHTSILPTLEGVFFSFHVRLLQARPNARRDSLQSSRTAAALQSSSRDQSLIGKADAGPSGIRRYLIQVVRRDQDRKLRQC